MRGISLLFPVIYPYLELLFSFRASQDYQDVKAHQVKLVIESVPYTMTIPRVLVIAGSDSSGGA